MNHKQWAARLLGGILLVVQFGALGTPPSGRRPDVASSQFDIAGPPLSGKFGSQVSALRNGNILVTDPDYNGNRGAVYLYNGATRTVISQLTGSQAGDKVGSDGFDSVNSTTLLIYSPHWANGPAAEAGAVTWFNTTTGVSGAVGPANSLVGSQASDFVGISRATILANGNVVIPSPFWANGGATAAGAVTWANGTTGMTGVVTTTNSLVGSQTNDQVASYGVSSLSNGNYVVKSPTWANDANPNAGAITWGNGLTGITGVVSTTNSLVGDQVGDQVSSAGVTEVSNGSFDNYVVASSEWRSGGASNQGYGAATWGNGGTGRTGVVSSANSLVGDQAGDQVGYGGVTNLSNGNYVVVSSQWRGAGGVGNGLGAITWANSAAGIAGVLSSANSLLGSQTGDQVGSNGVTDLNNGKLVISSPYWANGGVAEAGAATFANSTAAIIGVVTTTNSLVGSLTGDRVSLRGVTLLVNGNYVVESPDWANGGNASAGAVTWANGNTGITGVVTPINSLVGSQANDLVGSSGLEALDSSNAAYLVLSPAWANGGATSAGAVTLGDGTTGITGVVSPANSLVGDQMDDRVGSDETSTPTINSFVVSSSQWHSGRGAATWGNAATGAVGLISSANSLVGGQPNDRVGSGGILTELPNGSYVVNSPLWANGPLTQTGAVTWGNGNTGTTGVVSSTNSLVGTHTGDKVGSEDSSASSDNYSDNSYVFVSPMWANGGAANAGAVSLLPGMGPSSGTLTLNNSVEGLTPNGGAGLHWSFDCVNKQLVVGRPADNIVTLFIGVASCRYNLYLPIVAR